MIPVARRARAAAVPLGVVLLSAGLLSIACHRGPGPYEGAPIIVISIDTLRADHLPAYGYRDVETPALDALAADGIRFDNAYSHYPLTLPSHSSLLSGLLPTRHGVRDNAGYSFAVDEHPFLPRLFAQAGYATAGFVSSYVLRAETGLGDGFDVYDSDIEFEAGSSLGSAQRPGLETAARAAAWVREHQAEPFFLFLHLYEPHTPYAPPEPYASRYSKKPYDGEIATADAILGGFVNELERLGLYDDAVVVLVGDHGEGLGDHGEKEHGVFLYRSTLHVPFLLKLPGRELAGTVVEQPVGLVDVLPTLARIAGIEAPEGLDGRTLLPPGDDAGGRAIYAESYYPRLHFGWSDLQALYESRHAYIHAPEPELYDLAADPGQRRNVMRQDRRTLTRLVRELRELRVPLESPSEMDEETAEKLAALGYLAGSVHATGPLPDPKTQRHLLADLEAGTTKFAEQDFQGAVIHFRKLLDANAQMIDVWSFLGRSLRELGDHREAAEAFEKGLELSGGDPSLALAAAAARLEHGDVDRARQLAELARQDNREAADTLLSRIDLAQGNERQARARMERAVRDGSAGEPTLRRLALLHLQDGEPMRAWRLVEPLLQEGTEEPETLTVAGFALSDLGRLDQALVLFRRALQDEPDYAKAHEGVGTVLLKRDRPREARVELERALELNAELATAWNTLGVALYRLEGPAAALEAWQRAVTLDARQYDALFNVGLVAANAGRPTEARQALQQFLDTAPTERFAEDREKAQALLRQLGG